ncbi:clostripain-related cysteine peptidase [Treponema brennaborense]|uniref:Cell wall/surface repeat protein n=1 Tax=Treponema brennaborense (strain DSM 12168 / CIP 105900 / DD5/3) TaxID=906968 RepID=F4LMS4_TREBD|nr:clostripain-related cysteine peptidase [Treponema brennaborense]AEE17814.1 cell wall/surface repeat protein [Treponema brennaborense DSM 12168]
MKKNVCTMLPFLFFAALAGVILTGCPSPADPKPVVTYTLTFNSDDGSSVSAQTVESGARAEKPASPRKDGWHFGGWLTDDGQAYDFSLPVSGNITLKANWQVVVTFDANGGTLKSSADVTKESYFDKGAPFSAPEVEQTAAGKTYHILGWSEKQTATEASFSDDRFDLTSGSATSPVTLYAVWTEKDVFTVSFDVNGGKEKFSSVSAISGKTIDKPSGTPSLLFHYFRFWSEDKKTEYDFSSSVTKSLTLYALWSPKLYSLKNVSNDSLTVEYLSSSPNVSDGCITATYTTATNPADSQPLALTYKSQSGSFVTYTFPAFDSAALETYTISVTNGYETKTNTLKVVLPAPVSGLSASAEDSKIVLSWVKPDGFSSFDVECKAGDSVVYTATVSGASASIYGLTNNTEYTFKVTTTGTDKSVSVSATPKITRKTSDWLFLLYMDGDNNLNDPIFLDLNEVEYGLYNIRKADGSAETGYGSVNVVSLWDGFAGDAQTTPQIGKSGSYLYELGTDDSNENTYIDSRGCVLSSDTKNLSYTADWVVPRGSNIADVTALSCGEVNMGDKQTLINFLQWAQERYDAKNVVLQFSNHGGGPRSAPVTATLEDGSTIVLNRDFGRKALCWDEGSASAFLKTKDVSEALAAAGYGTTNKLGMILMDVCLGASIEDSYQFKDYAEYFAASPNNIPGMGMDYVAMMKSCTASATLESMGTQMVADYKTSYKLSGSEWGTMISTAGLTSGAMNENLEKVMWLSHLGIPTFSFIDLTKIDAVKTSVDSLATLLLSNMTKVFDGVYFDKVENTYVSTANENTEPVTYLEVLKDYVRFSGFSGNSLYYLGSFSWLFDIGYMASNMEYVSAATQGSNNVNAWPELNTASAAVITALDAAVVSSWRDAPAPPAAETGLYPVLNRTANPFGLTISGETVNINGSSIQPGVIPSFYKEDLAFGAESSWADLLAVWFGSL